MFPDDKELADIDLDGDLDMVVAYSSDKIVWWRNDDLEFTPVKYPFKENPINVNVIDFDGDGDMDFVAIAAGLPFNHVETGYVSWWENDGEMNFTRHDIDHSLYFPHDMEVADMDGDGDYDIVVGIHYFSNKMYLFENRGDMSFEKKVLGRLDLYGINDIEVIDFDNDGDLDVVFGAESWPQIGWFENDGAVEYVRHTIKDDTEDGKRIKCYDYDGDGDIDIFAEGENPANFFYLENLGDGRFMRKGLLSKLFYDVLTIDIVDIDSDGDDDIVLGLNGGRDNTNYLILESVGDFEFESHELVVDTREDFWGGGICVGDIDEDGRLDLALFSSFGDWGWWENQSNVGIQLEMKDVSLSPGDEIGLAGEVYNHDIVSCDGLAGFILLVVGDQYYFYPGWSDAVEYSYMDIAPGVRDVEFIHPVEYGGGAGAMDGLYFISAFLKPDLSDFYGNIHYVEFSFEE